MKLWDGRFSKGTEARADAFQASVSFDQRLYREDIRGSIAHATMLGQQGILSPQDVQVIVEGLTGILADFEADKLIPPPGCEDIHMWVEQELTARIGEAGKRLHTARSRNDQVALDMRLYAKRTCDETLEALRGVLNALFALAEKHAEDVMPGYTHMQRAQPVTVGHWALAYAEMLLRDVQRVLHAKNAADSMPLGAGALAGTTYPINRDSVRQQLAFADITHNSLDTVSDRDFVLDYLHAAATGMMHLSRLCEELVLFSTAEYGFVEMDDSYATGSSMMPQKKNPDMAELVRGKTGRVYGSLITLLTVMKGLPLAYNKDMQEDKEAWFDARDTYIDCLAMVQGMLSTMQIDTRRMEQGALDGYANATDCADYLVKKGVPFRDAHAIIGQLIAFCLGRGCALHDLTLEEFRQFSPVFDQDVFPAISLAACVSARNVPGGTAPDNVRTEAARARARLEALTDAT